MKKLLYLLPCLLLLPALLAAQDKMLLRNGTELQVKVLEIRPDSVYFSHPDSAGTQTVPRQDVFMITFPNGLKEVFSLETERPPAYYSFYTKQQLYELGRTDARKNFRAGTAYWTTLGATVLGLPVVGPFGGIGAAVAFGTTDPASKKIIPSNSDLLQEPAYLQGYKKQARNKKLGSAAGGIGTGLGVTALLLTIALAGLK